MQAYLGFDNSFGDTKFQQGGGGKVESVEKL